MNVKINRNAAKMLKKILDEGDAEGKMIRVFVVDARRPCPLRYYAGYAGRTG